MLLIDSVYGEISMKNSYLTCNHVHFVKTAWLFGRKGAIPSEVFLTLTKVVQVLNCCHGSFVQKVWIKLSWPQSWANTGFTRSHSDFSCLIWDFSKDCWSSLNSYYVKLIVNLCRSPAWENNEMCRTQAGQKKIGVLGQIPAYRFGKSITLNVARRISTEFACVHTIHYLWWPKASLVCHCWCGEIIQSNVILYKAKRKTNTLFYRSRSPLCSLKRCDCVTE